MTKLLSSYFKEDVDSGVRAEVHENDMRNGYIIRYFDQNGHYMMDEEYAGNTLQFVEDTAKNWVLAVKVLNG